MRHDSQKGETPKTAINGVSCVAPLNKVEVHETDFVTDPFAGTGGLVPADLTERYLPSRQVEFEVIAQVGAVRLWRATETRQVDGATLRLCRHHITRGECGEAFHIKELWRAKATFDMEVIHG